MEYFSIGRVFSRAFALVRDTVTSVGLFTLVIVLIEAAVSFFAQSAMLSDLGRIAASAGQAGFGQAFSGLVGLASLLGLAGLGLSWAGSVGGMLKQDRSGQVTLQDCVNLAIAGFLPALAICLLYWIGVFIGWMFIIVPGLILICMWAVALPAQLAEGIGIFEAFGRSRDLTRGHRLSIFGVLFVLMIAYYAISFAMLGSLFNMDDLRASVLTDNVERFSMIAIAVSIPLGWITSMVLKAVVTSLYIETITVKGGGPATNVAGVFD